MTASDYERLHKLIGMLASDSDGEVVNAVNALSRLLNGYGLAWGDIVLPRKLLPVRASVAEELQPEEDEAAATSEPPPLDKVTPKQMYDFLMASPNVSAETKRDIRRHADAIAAGPLKPDARGELQTMYNYAILKRMTI